MNERRIYSINDLPPDQTNLAKVRKISERQIAKAAREDEDVPLLTKEELAQFKRVYPPEKINVKKVRENLHISQAVFAAYFGVSKKTLQDWEQGRRYPRGPARILLTLIAKRPKLVQEVLVG